MLDQQGLKDTPCPAHVHVKEKGISHQEADYHNSLPKNSEQFFSLLNIYLFDHYS